MTFSWCNISALKTIFAPQLLTFLFTMVLHAGPGYSTAKRTINRKAERQRRPRLDPALDSGRQAPHPRTSKSSYWQYRFYSPDHSSYSHWLPSIRVQGYLCRKSASSLVCPSMAAQAEPDWFTEHPEDFPHEMLIDLAAVWSRKMPEATKFGLMEETNITDFEVENPE